MGAEWREVELAAICESIDYGFTASASTEPVGPKFLRITDIVGGPIDWHTVPFVHTGGVDAAKYRLHHGDIVVARTGATTGHSSYIKTPPECGFRVHVNAQIATM